MSSRWIRQVARGSAKYPLVLLKAIPLFFAKDNPPKDTYRDITVLQVYVPQKSMVPQNIHRY